MCLSIRGLLAIIGGARGGLMKYMSHRVHPINIGGALVSILSAGSSVVDVDGVFDKTHYNIKWKIRYE